MANSPLQPKVNKQSATPSLADTFNLKALELKLAINCHAIATIQSFDPASQTVTATVNYKKTSFNLVKDATTGVSTYQSVLVNYPVLVDCPAIVLSGGNSSLTLPITKGDECLILFNDRDIDNWFSGAAPTGVATGRLHSFADGIALVGLHSTNKFLTNYDMDRAVLRKGNAMVGVGKNNELVKIANEVTTLKTVINGLIDVIKAAVTIGGPTTQVLDPATQAALQSYKTTVGGLLE